MAAPRDVDSLNGPTWVYYAYCAHGGLLYVGIARDVRNRIKQHRQTKSWWTSEVDDVLATLYPTRRDALDVESHEIRTHRPVHNVAGQPPSTPVPHEVLPHEYVDLRVLDARGAAG